MRDRGERGGGLAEITQRLDLYRRLLILQGTLVASVLMMWVLGAWGGAQEGALIGSELIIRDKGGARAVLGRSGDVFGLRVYGPDGTARLDVGFLDGSLEQAAGPGIRLRGDNGEPMLHCQITSSDVGSIATLALGEAEQRFVVLTGGAKFPTSLTIRDTRDPDVHGPDAGMNGLKAGSL